MICMREWSRESRGQRIKLTQHLPRSNHTIEIVENCPRGGSNRVSALMQDNLRVEHRSNGRLVRRRSADTSNAKVPEVYAELSSLDTRAILPINVVRYHPSWSESNASHLSRAARRVFSREKGWSGVKVLSDRILFRFACLEDRLRVRESSWTPSGSK